MMVVKVGRGGRRGFLGWSGFGCLGYGHGSGCYALVF